MRRCILITLALLLSYASQGQLLDNKVNIYLGVMHGSFPRRETVEEEDFISPALHTNYKNVDGFSFKGLVKSNEWYSLGLAADFLQASIWELDQQSDYSNSRVRLYSLSPTVQVHTRFSEAGLLNRCRLFAEAGPSIGLSKLTLTDPLFDTQSKGTAVSQPMARSDVFFGMKGSTGVAYSFSKAVGIYVSYSLQHGWITSKLHHDKQVTSLQVSTGIYLRLEKDKRFFY